MRAEFLRLVPPGTQRILWYERGAATARAFAASGQPAALTVVADEEAAPEAAITAHLHAAPPYDAIVLIDALAYAADPWTLAAELCQSLAWGGRLILNAPNMRNLAIIESLVDGSLGYEEGALPAGALRLFTRLELLELLDEAGLVCEALELVEDPRFAHVRFPREGYFDIVTERVTIRAASPSEQPELKAREFLVAARSAVLA